MRVVVLKNLSTFSRILSQETEVGLLVLLGPLSKTLLLDREIISELLNVYGERVVIIPSSYDDYSAYSILVREFSVKICREKIRLSNGVTIYCTSSRRLIDRLGESDSNEIVFVERVLRIDPVFHTSTSKDLLKRVIFYHGTSGSPGIVIDRYLKLWIPFEYAAYIVIDYKNRSVISNFHLDLFGRIYKVKITGF
ncbi:MAG: hypothetical protein ABWJ42_03225 [Sulfolobales archaeon]